MDVGARNLFHGVASATGALRGIHALVLVGGRQDSERFGQFPLALLDVLGRTVLLRTLDRIRAAGVGDIAVVSDTAPLPPHAPPDSRKFSVVAGPQRFWDEARQQFRRLSRHSECVLVIRLGSWAEVDFAAMVNQHRQSGSAIVRAYSPAGEALDVFVVSSSSQSEAAALLRGELRDERVNAAAHHTAGFVNLLATPADLRALTLDAFAGDCEIHPCGRQLRPGVWVGTGARIHPCARVLAPAFIGDSCRVRREAVVTRGSSLERHSEVDCATVIDNSNVMPFTRVGAGLDVEYSVVGFGQVHSLLRKATVDVADPYLLGAATTQLSSRMTAALGWLLDLLPATGRIIFEPRAENETMSPIPALRDASLASIEPQAKSYRELAASERYGKE